MERRVVVALVLAVAIVLAGYASSTGSQGLASADKTTAAHANAPASSTTTKSTTTQTIATTATTQTSTSANGTSTSANEATGMAEPPVVKTEGCRYSGPGDDDIVRETGACLPFDADTVYRRVMAMAGVDLDVGVALAATAARQTAPYDFAFDNRTFGATMGIVPEREPTVFVPGFASPNENPDGTVSPAVVLRYVGLWNDTALQEELGITYTPADAEATAAHEFLHVVQFHEGSLDRLSRNLSTDDAANRDVVGLAVVEGSASFFESEYRRRYLNESGAARNVTAWSNASAYAMLTLGPYVVGEHYARWYLDGSTRDFERLYDDPPVSMEQLIHEYRPGEERPLDLAVEVRTSASSTWVQSATPETKGELFLRSALRAAVSGPKAARGAAGWGQDAVVAFQNASLRPNDTAEYGYAWAIRFDDASEATEFQGIFGEWLDATGSLDDDAYRASDGRTFRVVAIADETVVVLAGHEDFTTHATVTGNATHVVVEHAIAAGNATHGVERATGSRKEPSIVDALVDAHWSKRLASVTHRERPRRHTFDATRVNSDRNSYGEKPLCWR